MRISHKYVCIFILQVTSLLVHNGYYGTPLDTAMYVVFTPSAAAASRGTSMQLRRSGSCTRFILYKNPVVPDIRIVDCRDFLSSKRVLYLMEWVWPCYHRKLYNPIRFIPYRKVFLTKHLVSHHICYTYTLH